eukprot:scaffold15210_cov74-Skeletonema_dohrnii-CCMP3373.AAC.1
MATSNGSGSIQDATGERGDLLRTRSRYQNILGMLRWAVELGRMDTQHDVAAASRHLTLRDI